MIAVLIVADRSRHASAGRPRMQQARRFTCSSVRTVTATGWREASGPHWGRGANAADQPDEFLVVDHHPGQGSDAFLRHTLTDDQVDLLVDYMREVQQRMSALLDALELHPFRIPMRHRFRRVDHREGVLIRGAGGLGGVLAISRLSARGDHAVARRSIRGSMRCIARAQEGSGYP